MVLQIIIISRDSIKISLKIRMNELNLVRTYMSCGEVVPSLADRVSHSTSFTTTPPDIRSLQGNLIRKSGLPSNKLTSALTTAFTSAILGLEISQVSTLSLH